MAKRKTEVDSTFDVALFRIKKCREERQLDLALSSLNIMTLPTAIGQLKVLTTLSLHDNQLATLPTEIGQLKALTTLSLHDNQLAKLPTEIGQLKALRTLSLANNKLTTLPTEIGQLKALTTLSLASNKLATLPTEIGQLKALTKLYLFNNQISALPPEIGQLTAVASLDLENNLLKSLPSEIGQLRNLKNLLLSHNQFTLFPPGICQLDGLTALHLVRSQLTTLPSEIGKLTALTTLFLTNNQLSVLPPEIGKLKALTTLGLRGNQLTKLPPEIQQLTALKELYLHDNPVLGLPSEVLGPTWDEVTRKSAKPKPPREILDYYFSTRGSEGRALREVKLILVGRGEVGKSTLADVLQGKKFVKNRKSTDGIAITPWEIKLADGAAKVLMWDFGGQEIMHGTHQFFLTHRSLYVVIVDGRHDRQKQDAEYWLKLVRAFGGDSSVLVVMNRQKMHSFDMDRQYLAKKYEVKLEHFFRTDCESVKDIKPVRQAILKEVERMLSREERFPTKCWDVKERLENMKEDYLSDEDYAKVCQTHGIQDDTEQQKLLRRLVDLGIVVSFPDEIKLAELTVLNPEWVTDGIYRVMTNKPLREEKHGKLTLTTLQKLLPNIRWPKPKHLRYLVDLMGKFELCFPVEDEKDTVLVPELLQDETPPLPDWDPAQCVVFLYNYTVLPHGILPRFITKTYQLSEGRARWRSGVVVGDDGAEALIKADYDANVLSVWVRGDHRDSRRALLKVVRHHFDQIHGRIKDLNPKEEVAVPGHPEVTVPYLDLILDERDGKSTTRLTIDGSRVDYPISKMLDGIEPTAERKKVGDRMMLDRGTTHNHHYQPGANPRFAEVDQSTNIDGDVDGSQVAHTIKKSSNRQSPAKKKPKGPSDVQKG